MSAYRASTTNRRRRSTKAEMEEFRTQLYDIAEEHQPCSVRNVYYVGIGQFWDKDRGGKRNNYNRVCNELGNMREDGSLSWEWIADATRWCRIPTMYDSHEDALQRTAEFYRRDLWTQQPRRVEVWAESDSIAGVIDSTTRAYGVGLFSCRGQASKTFARNSAQAYLKLGKPVSVLFVGDWDPSGLSISTSLAERLTRYSNGVIDINFTRVAVTPDDVRSDQYVTHDVNTSDRNYQRFAATGRSIGLDPIAVEVEAIPPQVLRDRLEAAILDLVEAPETWNATLAAEESERELLRNLVSAA